MLSPPEGSNTIQSLKQEIDRLRTEQTKALQAAVFEEMTPDEARMFDDRRAKIVELIKELDQLQSAA